MDLNCAMCGIKACKNNIENAPNGCPSLSEDMKELIKEYGSEENIKIAQVSAIMSCQKGKTRIEETMEFANRCGFKKLGLAFCNALSNEAKIIDKVFKYNGFETASIMCKVGGVSRKEIGLDENGAKLCNPIAQAKFLNEAKTDLNIIIGLCIGHDSLFIKYSEAPVTVLAVKDRVLAHNPLGAVYLSESSYKNKLFPPKE